MNMRHTTEMFTMQKQCEQEFSQTHEVALKRFLDEYNVNGENGVIPVWQEHIAHRDFSYKMAMQKETVESFYEGKHDTWNTPNIVIEMIGSVNSITMEDNGIPFPQRTTKFDLQSNENEYNKLHKFVENCIRGEHGDINLGYASVGDDK
jgi:hypothetical protein